MVVLHTCKNEEDPIKNEDARVLTRLYVFFFQMLKGSLLRSQRRNSAEIRTHPIFYRLVVLVTCKNEEDPNKSI